MMSKSETGNRPGPDKPYYETSSGVVFPSAFMSNGITGAPPPPAMRGGPGEVGSGTLDGKSPRTSGNGIPNHFFGKGERG
jgi:hypothetical protein